MSSDHLSSDTVSDSPGPQHWRRLLAIGACAGDWSAAAICRLAAVSLAEADTALGCAVDAGVIDGEYHLDELDRMKLVAELTSEQQAEIHAAVARWAFSMGAEQHRSALEHARAAVGEFALDDLISKLERAGELSLSLGAYGDARDLLVFADELDSAVDPAATGRRLCSLAAALDGLGLVDQARHHLARAISLGEFADDPSLVADAAVRYALPVDWYAGDARAAGFLQRAEKLDLDDAERTSVLAARALVEMRMPLIDAAGQQFAWVTRPSVAQPMAEQARLDAVDLDDHTRLLALLSWRGTHRAPEHLNERCRISDEALDLAQRLRLPPLLVDAGVWSAVDHLESGDRTGSLRAMEVVRFVAEQDGNPRLRWRALTLAAGRAHLEGDLVGAQRHLAEAQAIGSDSQVSGLRGAELFFAGQAVISRDRPGEMAPFMLDVSEPVMQNPIGRAFVSYMAARTGDTALADRLVREAIDQLDTESSYLFLASRAAAAAVLLDSPELWAQMLSLLEPWSGRVIIDANGWWCDGPVDAWLALLHQRLGDPATAAVHTERARDIATSLHDVRTQQRLAGLVAELDATGHLHAAAVLTERQRAVLDLVANGHTNAEIAERLAYSVSTIRAVLSQLYEQFGTSERSELVRIARNRLGDATARSA